MSGKSHRHRLAREQKALRGTAGNQTHGSPSAAYATYFTDLLSRLEGKEGWAAELRHRDETRSASGVYLGTATVPNLSEQYPHFATGGARTQVFATIPGDGLRVELGDRVLQVEYLARFNYFDYTALQQGHPLYETLERYRRGELPVTRKDPPAPAPTLRERISGLFRELQKPENWV